MFSEVCGHFYVAAGLWAARQRLAEFAGGMAVLKTCISCHIDQHSPIEAATSLDLGCVVSDRLGSLPAILQ